MTANVARIAGLPTSPTASNRNLRKRPAAILGHARVARYVLHDDNRVIHQDPDREDQGEKSDSIQRVAVKVETRQRWTQSCRYGKENDPGFPKTEREPDQHGHRHNRRGHMAEQFAGFLLRGLSIIAGDRQLDIARHEAAAQLLDLGQYTRGDIDRVGALPLRDRYGHGRLKAGVPLRGEAHVMDRFLAAVSDDGYVANVNRTAASDSDDDIFNVTRGRQQAARLENDAAIAGVELSGADGAVCRTEPTRNPQRGKTVGRQSRLVQLHLDLPAPAADDLDSGDFANLLDAVVELARNPAKLVIPIAAGVKRQAQDRHVVDRSRLDQRFGSARRYAVEIREHFLVDPNNGVFLVLADVETNDHHRGAGAGGGVDVLDPGDLPQQLLHRFGDSLLHLARGHPRHRDENVNHRDDDLRLFFSGQVQSGEDARSKGERYDQRREFRVGERLCDDARKPQTLLAAGFVHEPLSAGRSLPPAGATTGAPSSIGPGSSTTRSPASSPESTS